jgi:spore maturation protein CgeB
MRPKVAMFYHSLESDWNHGNAHFLRGIASELRARGHQVFIFEPEGGWSRSNLLRDAGQQAIEAFRRTFPHISARYYDLNRLPLSEWLQDIDLVLVHEWNEPALVSAIGNYRRVTPGIRVLFHDTHHRAITAPEELGRFDLTGYDGVLAYGESLKNAYERRGWAGQVHVWHEAADVRMFYPRDVDQTIGDLVWIGNWGDEERSLELREYFVDPAAHLSLKAGAYGVRYPESALRELEAAGIGYGGWLPNFEVPKVFAQFRATVHIPRRPYTRELPGIPTIRPFEALACGIPLISAPWRDSEGLFRVGEDFLMAQNGVEMKTHLWDMLNDSSLARSLSQKGLETIRRRHTCGHRVDELLNIYDSIRPASLALEPRVLTEVHA